MRFCTLKIKVIRTAFDSAIRSFSSSAGFDIITASRQQPQRRNTMNTLTKSAAWILLSFVLLCAALSVSNAKADTKVYVGAWSTHLVTDGDYNESHDLVAVEHNGWIAGRFVNSYSRESWFVGEAWEWGGSKYLGRISGKTGGSGINSHATRSAHEWALIRVGLSAGEDR